MKKLILFIFLLLLGINGVFAWQNREELKEDCSVRGCTKVRTGDLGSAMLSGALMIFK